MWRMAPCGRNFVRAGKIESRGSDFEHRRIQHAGVFDEIVLCVEVDGNGLGRWAASGDEQRFRKLRCAFGGSGAILRGDVAVEIEDAAETCGWIDETGGGEIQRADCDFCVERSEDGIGFVDGASGAVDFEIAAAGEIGSDGHGEFGNERDVGGDDADVGVIALFGGTDGTDGDLSIFQFEFLDGEGGRSTGGWRVCRRGLGRRGVARSGALGLAPFAVTRRASSNSNRPRRFE